MAETQDLINMANIRKNAWMHVYCCTAKCLVLSFKSYAGRRKICLFYEIWLTQKGGLWKALCQSGRPTNHCEDPPQRKPWPQTPQKMRRNSSVPHFSQIGPPKPNERLCRFEIPSGPIQEQTEGQFLLNEIFLLLCAALSIDQSVKKCIFSQSCLIICGRQNDSLIVIEGK